MIVYVVLYTLFGQTTVEKVFASMTAAENYVLENAKKSLANYELCVQRVEGDSAEDEDDIQLCMSESLGENWW